MSFMHHMPQTFFHKPLNQQRQHPAPPLQTTINLLLLPPSSPHHPSATLTSQHLPNHTPRLQPPWLLPSTRPTRPTPRRKPRANPNLTHVRLRRRHWLPLPPSMALVVAITARIYHHNVSSHQKPRRYQPSTSTTHHYISSNATINATKRHPPPSSTSKLHPKAFTSTIS